MSKVSISLNFRSEKKRRNMKSFIEQIKQRDLMSKRNKRVCSNLFFVSGYVSISAFTSFVDIHIGIASWTVGLKISVNIIMQ